MTMGKFHRNEVYWLLRFKLTLADLTCLLRARRRWPGAYKRMGHWRRHDGGVYGLGDSLTRYFVPVALMPCLK